MLSRSSTSSAAETVNSYLKIPTLEIPSFSLGGAEKEAEPAPEEAKKSYTTEMPTFELPTLQIDTTPKESAYVHMEMPMPEYKPAELPAPKPVEIAPEEVIDLDAIDSQFETTVPEYYDDEMMLGDFEDEHDIALTEDDGVRKMILVEGSKGDTPKKGDRVLVHYEGKLSDGTVFDSSYARNSPFGVNIGLGNVVKGWDIGIMSMELGEKAELTIESDYGYGD